MVEKLSVDERLFAGDPAKRVKFLKYIFGVQSSAQLTLTQAVVALEAGQLEEVVRAK